VDPELIASADGTVLPGVGAFAEGMENLASVRRVVEEAVLEKPLLDICLGMQMLLERSEEHGMHDGLSMIPRTIRRFPRAPGGNVPQVGWNTITSSDHLLFEDIADGSLEPIEMGRLEIDLPDNIDDNEWGGW